jgi:hypothetical protein
LLGDRLIISNFIKENSLIFSDKGRKCLILALKKNFPHLDEVDDSMIEVIIETFDFNNEDSLKILNTASKYAKLYIFS